MKKRKPTKSHVNVTLILQMSIKKTNKTNYYFSTLIQRNVNNKKNKQ